MKDIQITIIVVAVLLGIFVPIGMIEYQRSECKQEAMKMKYTSSEIQVICK